MGVAARVSPAVDFPSLHPCPLSNPPDPLWSNSCAVVPQQTPRPPSPVFPERPVSPIQHATDIQALPAPPIYSYPPVPAPCYCPMCFPGVAWMAACPQFPCCLPPAPATPAFIDPTSGAPVFSCCLPMSTFPTGSTTSTFIPLGPHALPYPASAPSTSQVNSQLPYAIAISPKAGSVMSGQQVPPADSTSNAPNGPGEWVFEANSAASAYPLHG
ncbi:unnamed protein product [Mesocestoides corti]|uniref:Uncharacterized protein n=1 Tax=Mesocestoides corti TaxID=53468 RepID=A0A3P6GSE7_MESCO|nr:unnamed protein product [Mesocestoides corti]